MESHNYANTKRIREAPKVSVPNYVLGLKDLILVVTPRED